MSQTFDEMTQEVLAKLNLPLEGHAFAIIRSGIRKAYAVGEQDGRLTKRAGDKCPACAGSGYITKIDNRKVSCSACVGTGICA